MQNQFTNTVHVLYVKSMALGRLHYVTQVLPPFDFAWKIGNFEIADLFVYKIKFADTLERHCVSKLHLEINW